MAKAHRLQFANKVVYAALAAVLKDDLVQVHMIRRGQGGQAAQQQNDPGA
jgi:hypothetical protein